MNIRYRRDDRLASERKRRDALSLAFIEIRGLLPPEIQKLPKSRVVSLSLPTLSPDRRARRAEPLSYSSSLPPEPSSRLELMLSTGRRNLTHSWKLQLGRLKTIPARRALLPRECLSVRMGRTLRIRAVHQSVLEAGPEPSVHSLIALLGIPPVHPSSPCRDIPSCLCLPIACAAP